MSDYHNVNARITSIHREVLTQLGLTTNAGGVISSNTQLVDANGNSLLPSGTPFKQTVEITRPNDTTAYTALDTVSSTTASVKQKETITFTGTGGTANVTGPGGLTKLATFRTDLTTTAIDFESAHVAAYAAVGITLTRNLGNIILEATVAGVPFTAPVVTNVTPNLSGTVAHTTANYTAVVHEFQQLAITNGGGGVLRDIKIETNITTFAAKTIRVWLYNDIPSGIIGDNVAFTNLYADRNKLIGFVDVAMEALLTGSDSVVGQVSLTKQYKCANTSLFIQLESIGALTPTSGGKLNITFNVLKFS